MVCSLEPIRFKIKIVILLTKFSKNFHGLHIFTRLAQVSYSFYVILIGSFLEVPEVAPSLTRSKHCTDNFQK